jgi:hypothetical protein
MRSIQIKKVLRRCVVTRELLTMSTSALVLEDVRNVLFTSREDVFLHYSKGLDCLKGPFTCFEEYDSIDSLLFQTVKVESLVGFVSCYLPQVCSLCAGRGC